MPGRSWLALLVIGAAVTPEAPLAQLRFPERDSATLRQFVDTLSARFARRLAAAGYPLSGVPRVLLDARALGNPRRQGDEVPRLLAGGAFPMLNQIAIPSWTGVDSSQREDFVAFDTSGDPERMFTVFWNWLAPAHELSHLFQGWWGGGYLEKTDPDDYAYESEAFAIAIAFYRDAGRDQELAEAATLFQEAYKSLASLLPADTTGWSPASAREPILRCMRWTRQRGGEGGSPADASRLRRICPYRAILDLLTTTTGPPFSTLVRNIALQNDPARWPRSCEEAVELLVQRPHTRDALGAMSREDLVPAYTSWAFGSAVGGLGLTRGNVVLGQSCGVLPSRPGEVLHSIVERASRRLHPGG